MNGEVTAFSERPNLEGANRRAPLGPVDARHKRRQRSIARIKAAARELFLRYGYERTTLRAIARKARVSAAAIVNYFGDKEQLLALLFNEEHRSVTERAKRELSETKRFLEQSIDGFRHYYRYFAAHPDYARAILRLGAFYDPTVADPSPGGQAVARSIARIKQTIEIARKKGEITSDESDDALALLTFEVYQIECRHWLASNSPDAERGLARLQHSLKILQRGFTPCQ